MFFEKTKERVLQDYQNEIEEFNNLYSENIEIETRLLKQRENAVEVIDSVISKLNTIKNTPEKYELSLGEIHQIAVDYSSEEFEKKSYETVIETNTLLFVGLGGLGFSTSQFLMDNNEDNSDSDYSLEAIVTAISVLLIAFGTIKKTIDNKKIITKIEDAIEKVRAEKTKLEIYGNRLKNVEQKQKR